MSDFPPPPNSNDFPPAGADYPPAGQQPQEPSGYQAPPPPPQPTYPSPSQEPAYTPTPDQASYDRTLPGDDLLDDDLGIDRRRPSRDRSYRDQEPSRIELDDFESRDLRRDRGDMRGDDDYRGRETPQLARETYARGPLMTERQVEAIGWGLTVILFGFAILIAFTSSNTNFLTVGFPILGGVLLLASSVYQRIQGWRVSAVTWATAIGLSAFSITRLIAIFDGQDTGIGTSLAYFFGVFIIITGIVVLVRIFQQR